MINELCATVHLNAVEKGFFDDKKNIGEMLMLIVSEVAEVMEADRKDHYANVIGFKSDIKNAGQPDTKFYDAEFKRSFEANVKNSFEDELSDVVIRVFDMCGYKTIDLEWHIQQKMKYNSMREHKHGKKY